ncbi:MAG: M1 family aminopeptidase [Pyrinomonadaceae bacterium]
MTIKRYTKQLAAFSFAAIFLFSQIAVARPQLKLPPVRQDDKKVALPPANYVRSRNVDIKNILIDLRFDWNKEQAIGTATITLAPFKDLNAFTLDAAEMKINEVKLSDGKPLGFDYEGGSADNNLKINLPRVYKAGEDLTVSISYATHYVNSAEGDTAIGAFGRGIRFIKPTKNEPNKPYQIWSQGESEFNRYWFPSYDSPNDFRTTELRATVDKKYTVISNGKLDSVKDNKDGTHTFDWKMDIPYSNYLTSIVVGEYKQIKNGEYAGVPVYAYGYPSEEKEVAETTKRMPDMIKFFSEILGVKYAYPKYSQAMVEDFGGGMENISATTQIEEMIHDSRELLDEDSDSLQSHELAHQWFGDYVTTRDWGQIWLNESFATYFQALWDKNYKGEDYFLLEDVKGNQDSTIRTWNRGSRRPIVTRNYANKDAMFDTYAYPAGGAVLHMLRKQLGDQLFFKALNHYLTQNAHQPVSTEDLRIAFEEATGQSMDLFFNQWLYTMGHPIFEVTKSYDAAKKKLTLNVKQTQKLDTNNEYPQTELFSTFVDVEIDGNVQRVWIKPQRENVFEFDSPTAPKLVNFDYQGTLLKELTFEKPTDELIYQAQNDKDVIGRDWAIDELLKKAKNGGDNSAIVTALLAVAKTDTVYQIRRSALSTAVKIQGDTPNTAVVETAKTLVSDAKSLVRADAIRVLGETNNKEFLPIYKKGLTDPSYTVIGAAAAALAKTGDPNAFEILSQLANQESWHGRIRSAALRGIAELHDKRAVDLALKYATDKNQYGDVRIISLNVLGEVGKGDSRVFPVMFDQLKVAVDESDLRGVFGILQGIARLGDPRGKEAFDLLSEKYKDNPSYLGFVKQIEAMFNKSLNEK